MGFKRFADSETGRTFLYNKKTGETRWDDGDVLMDISGASDLSSEDGLYAGGIELSNVCIGNGDGRNASEDSNSECSDAKTLLNHSGVTTMLSAEGSPEPVSPTGKFSFFSFFWNGTERNGMERQRKLQDKEGQRTLAPLVPFLFSCS